MTEIHLLIYMLAATRVGTPIQYHTFFNRSRSFFTLFQWNKDRKFLIFLLYRISSIFLLPFSYLGYSYLLSRMSDPYIPIYRKSTTYHDFFLSHLTRLPMTFFSHPLYPLYSIDHFLFHLSISFFGWDPLVSIWHFFTYSLSLYRTLCQSWLRGARLLMILWHIFLITSIFRSFTYFLSFFLLS